MGKLTPHFKTAMVEDIIKSIQTGSSYYYGFAANPDEWTGNTIPIETSDEYTSYFFNNWTMLFGKRITNTDIFPVIRRITWAANTVYDKFDNTKTTLGNSNFYVIVNPSEEGGFYNIFKCLNNANGAASTAKPEQIQATSFTTEDGYVWRYITSIADKVVKRFGTEAFMPVYANGEMVESAYEYSGIDVVTIQNSGVGYDVTSNGTILGIVNSTVLQISSAAEGQTGYYTNNSIYITSNTQPSQLRVVSNSFSNASGIYVRLSSPATTSYITPSISRYYIGPQVKFSTDGDESPSAIALVNASTKGIHTIQLVNKGYGITRADIQIITSPVATASQNTATAANVVCIPAPPGGHGANPVTELYSQGVSFNFNFANSELGTIPINVKYNKIGLIKNPSTLTLTAEKGGAYTANTFNSLINAALTSNGTPSPFTVGDILTGQTSGAKAKIAAIENVEGTSIKLVGDKNFIDTETVIDSSNNSSTMTTEYSSIKDIYTKDLYPMYFQNIEATERSNSQIESFKIIIQV
jgi:hypothetical protein